MERFSTRAVNIEALQFTWGVDMAELATENSAVLVFVTSLTQAGGHLREGDYIIKHPDGTFDHVPKAVFEKIFEKVEA